MFADAISEIRRSVSVDGKNTKTGSNFMYQRVKMDTKVLNFDDVTKGFEFEKLFSVITEGLTVERKGADEFHIPFEDSPKIVISSNYSIEGEGSSFERRTHNLEFNAFYSPSNRPSSVAGRRFFEKEWMDSGEYNIFYNYMLECLQGYLETGLVEAKQKGSYQRKFMSICPQGLVPAFHVNKPTRPFTDGEALGYDQIVNMMLSGGLTQDVVDSVDKFHAIMVAYGWMEYGRNISHVDPLTNTFIYTMTE